MHDSPLSFRSAIATVIVFLMLGIITLVDILDGPGDERQERVAKTPTLPSSVGSLPRFLRDTRAYISKRYALKDEFVWANGAFKGSAFGHSTTARVNFGKEGFFFLNDDAAITSAQGLARLNPTEIEEWVAHFSRVNTAFREVDIPFVFIMAPNKHSVYSDALPDWVRPVRQGENRADDVLRLAAETLSEQPVNAKQVLAEHRSNHPAHLLYHKTDTHWNALGAALVVREAIASLGGEIDLPNSKTLISPKSGDLARMIGQQYSIPETIPTLEHKTEWRCFDPQNVALTIETIDPVMPERFSCKSSAENDKRVVAFIDSFGVSAIPILASSFQEIEFIWQDVVNPQEAKSLGADIVIQIIVERKMQYVTPANLLSYEKT